MVSPDLFLYFTCHLSQGRRVGSQAKFRSISMSRMQTVPKKLITAIPFKKNNNLFPVKYLARRNVPKLKITRCLFQGETMTIPFVLSPVLKFAYVVDVI